MSDYGPPAVLETAAGAVRYHSLAALDERNGGSIHQLPYSLKVLLEGALRQAAAGWPGAAADVAALASWPESLAPGRAVSFRPDRMLLQDFTGLPALIGLAALRTALERRGGDPSSVDPVLPTDLVIDHSLQVDVAGVPAAAAANLEIEYRRNAERYRFARWAERAFSNLRVVPPGNGIVHQVNMEFLATVVAVDDTGSGPIARPDTLVGTDSHTTMINALGVLGWGVGGIEAEAAMLGEAVSMVLPEVVGVCLTGVPRPGVTGTDLVLAITRALRAAGVVGAFVEFSGSGLDALTATDRATIANMAPEYGATVGYFPVDAETVRYLGATARPASHLDLVERYCRAQGLFRAANSPDPVFSRIVDIDLGEVGPIVAGPRRPDETRTLAEVPASFRTALAERSAPGGFPPVDAPIRDGDVAIAAITSCTNTSNPAVMIGAGLLARNAVERGMTVPGHVKTSLAPGSPVVADYLARAGLLPYLEKLGFAVVGYGCTTCAGGGGALAEPVAAAIDRHDLTVAAVLSGNRNFEGRIHPLCRLAYLASPPLVVAYALAGTVDLDLAAAPLGTDATGTSIYLSDLWPDDGEISALAAAAIEPGLFAARRDSIFSGDERWGALAGSDDACFAWDPASTYVREPPFATAVDAEPEPIADIVAARCLLLLGDGITTDHISPGGAISPDGPAGRHLLAQGVSPKSFSTFGSRRGNHEVMVRGTFANPRLRNELAAGREGGWTVHHPSGELMSVYDAATRYRGEGTPLVVIAGAAYGAGSSRDWAAKGTALLGVRAVVAGGFERLHRLNLIGTGVLPLEFASPGGWQAAGISGDERLGVRGLAEQLAPGATIGLEVTAVDGTRREVPVTVRLESDVELAYYRHGGIVPFVFRTLLARTERPRNTP